MTGPVVSLKERPVGGALIMQDLPIGELSSEDGLLVWSAYEPNQHTVER